VPPNWDSWGKIRVLRDGFDVEAINKGWSLDIEESHESPSNSHTNGTTVDPTNSEPLKVSGGAVESYEETIRDPILDALQATSTGTNGLKLEVSSLDTQSFLATQVEVLDKIRHGADNSGMDSSRVIGGRSSSQSAYEGGEGADEGRVNEHIGPVQFNMGGIQVDADDMLQRLKVQPPIPI
jgi:dynein light intermediate chain 1, cytosolic